MSRIDDLIAEHCPNEVQFKTLGETGEFVRGNGIQKKDLTDEGVGAIHYGEIHTHYGTTAAATKSFVTETLAARLKKARPGDLVIATTSEDDEGVAKAVAWVGDGEIAVSGDAYIYRHRLEPRYVAYFFQSDRFQDQKKLLTTGTKVRRISGQSLSKIRIPVPPLAIQQEIASILTKLEALEAELGSELKARRVQYGFYQELLLLPSNGVRWMTLGKVGKVLMCRRVFKTETSTTGDVPFYKIGTFGGTPDAYISRDLFESYRARYSFPNKGDVLLSAAGTIGRAIPYDGKPAYFQDSNIVWLDNDESIVKNTYLRYWYRLIKWSTDGGTIRRLYNENIRRARIAVPSLAEQERIVATLDKFDALVNDPEVGLPAELNARRRQFEHYRERLFAVGRRHE